MKKGKINLIIVLSIFLLISGLFGYKKRVFALETSNFEFKSKCCYMIDYNSGTEILKHNENERRTIASMCKIMTLLLCFESMEKSQIDFNDYIVVSENASSMGGSQIFLENGGEYKVSELIKGIVVASANDACVAMAESLTGSEETFVDLMNVRAKELKMENTNFVNCTGLPKAGQYSSAKDVAIMFSELLKHPKYFEFSNIWMDKIQHPKDRITEISNTNKLIRFYKGCDGGKTGFTTESGHCLSATAMRNGMRLISVVISSPDSKTRFKEVSDMFNYGFANYSNKRIVDRETPLDVEITVKGGKKDFIKAVSEKDIFVFCKKDEKCDVEISINPIKIVKAPIKKGDTLGELLVFKNGIEIARTNIISYEDISRTSYGDNIVKIISNWSIL